MNLEKAKKTIENINSHFEYGFIDYYLDFLYDTIEACDTGIEALLLRTMTDIKKIRQIDEQANSMQKLKMDALDSIYEIYSDLEYLIKE